MTSYEDALRRRHRPAHATRTAQSHAAFLWHAWGGHPGAYLARLWCEAIGFAD